METVSAKENIVATVVCLTYNHERYLAQALESILRQKTEYSFEIIVSDDASRDQTLSVAEQYRRQYPSIVRLLEHPSNVGAAQNAYDAMRMARGKYLLSCEGDDFWISPDKLQTQVSFLETHPQFIGCYHSMQTVDAEGRAEPRYLPWISHKKLFRAKDFKGIFLPGQGCTWCRRNLFLSPDFDGSLLYTASRDIADRTNALLWVQRGDFARLEGISAAYRCVRSKNATNATSKLYADNTCPEQMDFDYTMRLGDYLQECMDKSIDLEYHKRELCAAVLLKRFRQPHVYAGLFSRFIRATKHPFAAFWAMPYFIFRKVWHKIRRAG